MNPLQHPLLNAFSEQRRRVIQSLTQALRADERISAAWLFGSIGRREEDALSDIDLWVVVKDADCADMIANRQEFVSLIGAPIHTLEAPQNAPQNGACLLALYDTEIGLIHIDWYWEPESQARVPRDVRLLFDRAELSYSALPPLQSVLEPDTPESRREAAEQNARFFWAMVPIAAKYIGRRQVWGALGMMQMLRGTMLHLARHTHSAAPKALDLPPVGDPLKLLELLRSLARGVESLHPAAERIGVCISKEAPLHIARYLDQMETLLRETP
jgi:predicted nucleotidyltransferase